MNPITGKLVENRIVVWSIQESRALFGNGYYGKPLGVPKPKGTQFDTPLILDLIEGCYLVHVGKLKVFNIDGKKISFRDIQAICRREYGDFAVYEHGPGIDHAPYLVQVLNPTDHMTATGIVLAGRLATTVRKQFILAIPKIKGKRVDFVSFDWWRA
jgi:tRNA-intron endonuclease, archaea type